LILFHPTEEMADKHGRFLDSWSSQHEAPSLMSSQLHNERGHGSDSYSESSYVSTDKEEDEQHHSLSEAGPSQPAASSQHGESAAPAARNRASETRLAEETRGVSGFGLGHSLSLSGAAFVQGVAADERASVRYLQSLGPMNPLVRPSLVQQHQRRGKVQPHPRRCKITVYNRVTLLHLLRQISVAADLAGQGLHKGQELAYLSGFPPGRSDMVQHCLL
jgi:hypothetical protein